MNTYTILCALCCTASLLPGVYIRYYPFHQLLGPSQKQHLCHWYAAIYIGEAMLIYGLLSLQILPFAWYVFKSIVWFGWIPYMLPNLCILRPYMTQQVFVLGMQSVYTLAIHILSTNLFIMLAPSGIQIMDYLPVYYMLFIGLFFLLLPVLKTYFRSIFIAHGTIYCHYVWKYICPIPLLLACTQGMILLPLESAAEEYAAARLSFIVSNVSLAIVLQQSIHRLAMQQTHWQSHLRRLNKMQSLSQLAHRLELYQQQMSVFRHDTRHQFRLLAALLQERKTDDALALLNTWRQKPPRGDDAP